MPQPRRGQQQQRQQPQDPELAAAVAEKARHVLEQQYVSYAEEADAIWKKHGKGSEGELRAERLTHALFAELEPLLRMPTPPMYIEHRPQGQGNPYPTTGLRSTQIQFDRMNDVLGVGRWRHLLFYTQQGQLAKAVVIVGNDLEYCRLDDAGNFLPYTLALPEAVLAEMAKQGGDISPYVKWAEVIAIREGWGGWKSNKVGDTWKSSETNALKRVLARFGPGADVYRVDYEEDILAALKGEAESMRTEFDPRAQGNAARGATQAATPRQAAAQQRQGGQQATQQQQTASAAQPPTDVSEEEAEKLIEALLKEKAVVEVEGNSVDLQAMRKAADEAMRAMPQTSRPSASTRWKLLAPRKDDPRQLADLKTRAENTTE